MELAIWIGLNGLVVGAVIGAIIGFRIAKNRTPVTDASLSIRLAALEATESELRIQIAKANQDLTNQQQKQDQYRHM